ncbi:hypothetical protein [Brevundimonas sp.]|uniref:hypothetical protein n=1 Tax=Brevundimonas sp. TaxID=1871086 RepID=UPI0027FFF94A|nr:hypothetical protein [Brevundimonas sp.]MDQ7813984.1 hypothetical protein [Brevundimonas sp.]
MNHDQQMREMGLRFLAEARRGLDAGRSEESVLQNVGWGLELVLKAALQSQGWNDDRCRREIRHDLLKALDAVEKTVLARPRREARAVVGWLSQGYRGRRIGERLAADPPPWLLSHAVGEAERLAALLTPEGQKPKAI